MTFHNKAQALQRFTAANRDITHFLGGRTFIPAPSYNLQPNQRCHHFVQYGDLLSLAREADRVIEDCTREIHQLHSLSLEANRVLMCRNQEIAELKEELEKAKLATVKSNFDALKEADRPRRDAVMAALNTQLQEGSTPDVSDAESSGLYQALDKLVEHCGLTIAASCQEPTLYLPHESVLAVLTELQTRFKQQAQQQQGLEVTAEGWKNKYLKLKAEFNQQAEPSGKKESPPYRYDPKTKELTYRFIPQQGFGVRYEVALLEDGRLSHNPTQYPLV